MRCEVCNGKMMITDVSTGEIICKDCGVVIAIDYDDRLYSSDHAKPLLLTRHDKGLSTTINALDIDASGNRLDTHTKVMMMRIRRLDSNKNRSSFERSMLQFCQELDKVRHKIGINDKIVEEAISIFKKAKGVRSRRGSTIASSAAACIYLACKNHSVERSIKEIADAFNIKPSMLLKAYSKIIFDLGINPPSTNNSKILYRLGNNLSISGKVLNDALLLLSRLSKSNLFMGKNPIGLAAATLFIASKKNNQHIRLRHISREAQVSDVTLRKFIKLVSSME